MLYVVLRGAAYGRRCSTSTLASRATSAATPVSPGPAPPLSQVSSFVAVVIGSEVDADSYPPYFRRSVAVFDPQKSAGTTVS